jgi:hypothetical protein
MTGYNLSQPDPDRSYIWPSYTSPTDEGRTIDTLTVNEFLELITQSQNQNFIQAASNRRRSSKEQSTTSHSLPKPKRKQYNFQIFGSRGSVSNFFDIFDVEDNSNDRLFNGGYYCFKKICCRMKSSTINRCPTVEFTTKTTIRSHTIDYHHGPNRDNWYGTYLYE